MTNSIQTAHDASATLISVISPIYGCRSTLTELAKRVEMAFQDECLDWELVLVDDRGPDQPWPVIEELSAKDPRIRGIRLARNHGQHLAIWAGLEAARGDFIVVIDCDLQDDPSVIPELYRLVQQDDVEAVIVDRGTWSDSKLRRMASNSFYALVKWLAGVKIDNIGNFGIYSRRMVNTLLLFTEQEIFLPIMVSLTGYPTTKHQVDRGTRHEGSSSYNFLRLLRLAVAIVIRFSDRPLKLSVLLGGALSGMSALISFVLLMMWLAGSFTVQGWTSTILSIWFLSGLILATLGIHGFYLGRVFREVQGRPRILIQETTDLEETALSRARDV
ncbi:glycosyltransferase family 2 protein (plasmid) [Ruegeria sp. SCSIO 43209]|uniref:glycosyltransferase family 2 protein n=1 Tax=Ruegeria sp. SCSIO 43209 TaxID=2793010 RepID=UPI00147A93BA|nr:glycosyltransferase family 2 protein [Ruegeria sp. SCSIO 43209]UAB91760.1 glycosyltransferase family 2 protein [Ruegeria sp. SCSIO 43209]